MHNTKAKRCMRKFGLLSLTKSWSFILLPVHPDKALWFPLYSNICTGNTVFVSSRSTSWQLLRDTHTTTALRLISYHGSHLFLWEKGYNKLNKKTPCTSSQTSFALACFYKMITKSSMRVLVCVWLRDNSLQKIQWKEDVCLEINNCQSACN